MTTQPSATRVGTSRARMHVYFHLQRSAGGSAVRARVAGRPFVVEDLDNGPLFYLFAADTPGAYRQRWVRAAADRRVGPPILAVDTPATAWHPQTAVEMAVLLARKESGWEDVTSEAARLVCYDYPRIGVELREGDDRLLFDAVSLAPVPLSPTDPSRAPWSFYGAIDATQEETRKALWARGDAELRAALGAGLGFRKAIPPDGIVAFAEKMRSLVSPPPTHGVLRREAPLDCFPLYGEVADYYCTAAVAQMILRFYGYPASQEEIATALGIDDPKATLPELEDQRKAYEDFSGGKLAAKVEEDPTWEMARDEIQLNHPLKEGHRLHARVCTGWGEYPSLAGGASEKWLRFHDPQPSTGDACTGGSITWERWDAIPHLNFIFVRPA